jgi:signal transduction histidine kinase
VILAGFAGMVGVLTDRQVRGQFDTQVRQAADNLQKELSGKLQVVSNGLILDCDHNPVPLSVYASAEHAQIRIFDTAGQVVCTQQNFKRVKGAQVLPATPNFSPPVDAGAYQQLGYRLEARWVNVNPGRGRFMLAYARPLSDVEHTLARVQFVLLLGVLGGTLLALLAGLATAQRAVRPVVQLTEAAREIERTRDPTRRIPHPEADDEVAELARTLEGMLAALDAARARTEAMLDRQREFVADASHELRTPLTSVLANLELLAEELEGEQADSAQSALRATRRMRRLVGDLLLLARADAKRAPQQRPTDLADVVTEAAVELGPLAEEHELSIAVEPAIVPGIRDDLYRMVLNLMENAVKHTPPGTHISASTSSDGTTATITVEDDGPGIDPALERRVFDRFVRGSGNGTLGSSSSSHGSGLGLAIVRAVAEAHGGTVSLERPDLRTGTRFVITLPQQPAVEPPGVPLQTSTTTGSTIGRRRSRS